MLEKIRDREALNEKLKKEVGVATEQLRKNCTELATSKTELQRRRIEISVSYTVIIIQNLKLEV